MTELRLPAGQAGVDPGRASVQFVGNATVLLRYAGLTVLTDPSFVHAGDHVHLGYGLKTKRLLDPALELEALPPIDLVLLSHLHGDHFDQAAEARLDREVPIVTTPHAARRLARRGFQRTLALRPWERLTVIKPPARLAITATPGRHGPRPAAWLLPPVMGSVLELGPATARPALRLWISGDTLVTDTLHELPRRWPGIDLALLHLGGTRVLGVLVTMDAEQGVEALRRVQPRRALPIHTDDFDVFTSSLDDFLAAARAAGFGERIVTLARGERLDLDVPAAALRGRT
ncbi:MAG: MBL fold metallo-hydrolase [Planctomycetes bacterium]|nr:MBL fold metallo-hydrolase [Planctomycetota bacterium]